MRRSSSATAMLVALAAASLVGCEYVVVPPESGGGVEAGAGWTAMPTRVESDADGTVVVELALRNDTNAWSTMAAEGPARLTGPGGTTDCDTVHVGTGGHRVAPGVQLRGYQAGKRQAPETQLVRVECADAALEPGARLEVDYRYATGDYNYYDPEASTTTATLDIPLDAVAADLTYPIATEVDGLVEARDAELPAINGMSVVLTEARRVEGGLELDWTAANPGEYPSSVHIGIPPVIGSDGIVYGTWESPDLASVPLTPPGETSSWTTEVAVPDDVTGLHVLLSVENGKARLFANHLLDLSDL